MHSSWPDIRHSGDPQADLPIRREPTLTYRITRLVGIPLLHVLFRIEVVGRGRLPRAPFVLIANHLNWLDSFLLLMALPAEPRVHMLADPELLRRRRLQWWIVRHAAGYIAVDRRLHPDTAMFARVAECLRVGAIFAIYPEGNYGPDEGGLLPLKSGFAHFAIQANVPVVPVALSGTKEPWLRKRLRVVVGEAITPGVDVEALVAAGEASLRNLLPVYREPPGPKPFKNMLTHLF